MKLLPVPGAPGYRIDCDNMVAYSMKRGVLKKLNERTKYRTVHLTIDRITYGTTIYRMMYCATNNIDITKIPRDLCIGLMGGTVTVMTRSDVQAKTIATKRAARMQVKKWSDMVWKIHQYYKGDCKALLDELKRAQKWVERCYRYLRHEQGACGTVRGIRCLQVFGATARGLSTAAYLHRRTALCSWRA